MSLQRVIRSLSDLLAGVPYERPVYRDGSWGTARLPYFDQRDYYTASDGTDYLPSVTRAVADLAATGGRGEIVLLPRAEAYRGTLDLATKTTLRGGGSATEWVHDTANVAGRLVRAQGTVGTKTALDADALAGASTITLPAGAGASWAAGEYVEVESTTIVYGSTGRTRDIRKVESVAGDVLTVEGVLIHDFLTSASATFAKVTMLDGVTVRDMAFSCEDPTLLAHTLYLSRVADLRVLDVALTGMAGGILLYDIHGGVVSRPLIDFLPNGWQINPSSTGNGYGVVLAGATSGVEVDGLRSRHVRHAVTTLSDERSGPTYWGGPRDCTIANSFSEQAVDTGGGGTSHFDTHEFGTNIAFVNCVADGGGEAGFQDRAQGTSYTNCRAFRCGQRGLSASSLASGTLVQGGEYAFNKGTAGISFVPTADGRIVGAWIHDNDAIGVLVTGTDHSVEGCRIESNGVLGVSTYGIQETSATRARYVGNLIPYEAARQTIAILNMGATAAATGNVCLGYPVGPFFGNNAAARIVDNLTDPVGVVADVGNAAKTLSVAVSDEVQVWNTPLTADRAVTLSATSAYPGATFRIVRTAAATGAFSLNVGTGPLRALDAGEWCDVTWNGSAWFLAAYGMEDTGGAGAPDWGDIGGTLSDQTDLQAALDAKQASDAELAAIAGLTSAADRVPYFTGLGAAALATFTAAGRALVDDADAAAQRATLGFDADLNTLSLPASTTISTFGASLVDDANAAAAIATLGLDADLATFAVPASTTISAFGATLIDDAAASNARTTLGLAIGADVQAYNAGTHKAIVSFLIDGGGSAITTGIKGDLVLPDWAGTIVKWTLLGDQSGSIVVDLWKDTYANFPPVDSPDSITASAPPTITTATKGQSSTLTGWTTSFSAGDIIRVNVDSITTLTRVTLALDILRS